MNKTLKLFLMFILVLFFALIFVNTNVYATDVITLTQADFDLAKDTPNEDTGKMKYLSGNGYAYYFMTKPNYKLDENINIGAASIAFYPDFVGEKTSLDLSKYTLENGTAEEYDNAGVLDERKTIIFQNTNANITGTGMINSNSGYEALCVLEYDEEGIIKTKNQEISNIKIEGGMLISGTKVTIDNVNLENGTLKSKNSDVIINGGTYKNLASSGAINCEGSNVTINSGTFTANIASAMYFFSFENNEVLTINNGTFTSTEDNGIEIIGGTININNGTFTGAMSGITTSGYKALKISGGTYKYTDIQNGRGPIAMYDVEVEDAIATIAENKVLSAGEFEKIEKEITSEYFEPYTETYISINEPSVTVQNKYDNTTEDPSTGDPSTEEPSAGTPSTEEPSAGTPSTEDTIVEISTTPSSDVSSVEANIKFTTPIAKENRLEILKQDDDQVSKELKTKEPNLKVVYDINVISNTGEITKIENNKMTIKIKLDENLLGYDNYEVVYIKDGKVEERISATVKDGYIIFETSHLSEYGVVASSSDDKISVEETTTNPQTGDNIIMYGILFIVAVLGSVSTIIILKKNK